jgi:hypothetical protein
MNGPYVARLWLSCRASILTANIPERRGTMNDSIPEPTRTRPLRGMGRTLRRDDIWWIA